MGGGGGEEEEKEERTLQRAVHTWTSLSGEVEVLSSVLLEVHSNLL